MQIGLLICFESLIFVGEGSIFDYQCL